MSRSLSSVLHVPDLRQSRSSGAKHLYQLVQDPSRGWSFEFELGGTNAEHDRIRDKSLKRDAHGAGGDLILRAGSANTPVSIAIAVGGRSYQLMWWQRN